MDKHSKKHPETIAKGVWNTPCQDKDALTDLEYTLSRHHIAREDVEDVYPCTPMQEGLMALTLKAPGKYVATIDYALREGIDIARLRAAVDSTVAASPILRTRFMQGPSSTLQVVIRERTWWEIYSTLQDYETRFRPPNMTLNERLLHFASIEHPPRLVMTIHHALCDGWSMSVLGQREGSTAFWLSHFKDLKTGIYPTLPFPAYEPKPDKTVSRTFSTPSNIQTDHTLSTAIQLAWAVIMSYYTDSEDVVYGLTLSGRAAPIPGIDQLMGPTITTVPFRVRLDLENSILSGLQNIQRQYAAMIEHEQTGLRKIRQVSENAASACEFQSHLVIQPPLGSSSNGKLVTKLSGSHVDYAPFSSYGIVLVCHLSADSHQPIHIIAQYDSNMLESGQAQRIVAQFEHVLHQILTNPRMPASSISAVSDQDWQQLGRWNATLPKSVAQCVHDLILEHSISRPNAPAVSAWNGEFTFKELALVSGQLAHSLRDQGLQKGSIVPVCLEKSKWCVVAMLAVLRAGAAVICIEPKLPEERLRHICDQVQPHMVLTSRDTRQKFTAYDVSIISVPSMDANPGLDDISSFRVDVRVEPSAPAFISFTSGSTGRPKGIIIEHRDLSTSIQAHSGAMSITKHSRMLHFASYAFDASIYEIFSTLVIGGCVCIISELDRMNGLERFIAEKQVNLILLVPSMLAMLDPSQVPSVETVDAGGEAMTRHVANRWASRVRLINAYGPAEATICAAGPVIEASWKPGAIGPLLGGAAWVTVPSDPARLVPLGATGELLIEGPIVTRGYLNSPEQTRAAYIDAPEWLKRWRKGRPGRLYRSGDLVELTVEGTIQFIGRKDTQVKLRGQRIELAEVEYNVRRCTESLDVVADVAKVDGASTLFVCIIQDSKSERPEEDGNTRFFLPPTESFRRLVQVAETSLRSCIPRYMIPSVFLPLEQAPQTTGGKVDRRRLREAVGALNLSDLQGYTAVTQGKHRQPSNELETTIQAVWARVLSKTPCSVGLDDSFFHLGGDSITAMQIVSQLKGVGVQTNVDAILKHGTIASLAPTVSEFKKSCSSSSSIPSQSFRKVQCDQPFALSPIQQLFLDLTATFYDHFNHGLLLRLQRPVVPDQLHAGVCWLVQHHPMLRARFGRHASGTWYQTITTEVEGSYQFQHHQNVSCANAEGIYNTRQKIFQIERGVLMALDLMKMQNGEQWLSFIVHHVAIDNVSWKIILNQLELLLDSKPVPQATSMSYQAWCHHLGKRIKRANAAPPSWAVSEPMVDFWGLPEGGDLFKDAREYIKILDSDSTRALLGPANDAFRTRPADLLQAALMYTFAQTFPERAIPTLFLESHGREPWDDYIDVTGTVGWFTSIWPCWVDIDSRQDLFEVIRRTKKGRDELLREGQLFLSTRKERYEIEIMFNYVGSSDLISGSLFERAPGLAAELANQGPQVRRFAVIDVQAQVTDGELMIQFIYNGTMAKAERIVEWADRYQKALGCLALELPTRRPELTTADFPLLKLTDEQFQRFQSQVVEPLTARGNAVVDAYPCSPMQRGMLLSQVKNPKNYVVRILWTIQSKDATPVGRRRLISAWQRVVERHSLLRTVFVDNLRDDDGVDQVVLDTVQPATVSRETEGKQLNELVQLLAEMQQTVFPPMHPQHRLTLCWSASGSVACALEISHVLVDGASSQILQRDLLLAYDGLLPHSADRTYADYVFHVQQQPSGPAREYWDLYTKDLESCFFPRLATDSSRVKNCQTARIGRLKRAIPDLSHLRGFCRAYKLTMATIFQVAWGLVLRAYTQAEDVCYGLITSGREAPIHGIDDAIGPFINILVRRMDFGEGLGSLTMLQKTQKNLTHSLKFQHYSLADIVHRRQRILFNTAMSVQPVMSGLAVPAALLAYHAPVGSGLDPTELDVALNIYIDKDSVYTVMDHSEELFTHTQAGFVLDAFEQAVQGIVHHEDRPVRSVSLLGGESRGLVSRWTRSIPQTVERLVGDMVLDHCRTKPSAQAVCGWDGTFTYAQLESHSARLSYQLRSQYSVKAEVLVPIYAGKSRWVPVAIMAVIRAGGAFVLLDPGQPLARLQSICTCINATLILTDHEHQEAAKKLVGRVVVFGREGELPEGEQAQDSTIASHALGLTPSNALYCVFTSGSTGQLKGVVIEHRSFATTAITQAERLRIGPKSCVLQFTSFSFDVSVGEILVTLIQGGCVCIPSEDQLQQALAPATRELQANWALLVPSMARALRPTDFPTLRTLVLGGEAAGSKEIEIWSPALDLLFAYGPAECTPFCTATVEKAHPGTDGRSIGRPFSSRVRIVDPHNPDTLVPIGAVGEMVVEGPIVGRGYLNASGASFMEKAQSPHGESRDRAYRTGDLVRYNPDGTLQFISRKDLQVKLRGQRFELAEVEYHLWQCLQGIALDLVVEIVTPKHGAENSPSMLVAFVADLRRDYDLSAGGGIFAAPDESFYTTITAAISQLELALPLYMVPTVFIPIPQVPVGSTGKANRRALREAAASLPPARLQEYTPPFTDGASQLPTTAAERTFQRLFADVLGLGCLDATAPATATAIKRTDHFRRLGGDSIRAMTLIPRAREAGYVINMADVLNNPRLCDLALVARQIGDNNVDT